MSLADFTVPIGAGTTPTAARPVLNPQRAAELRQALKWLSAARGEAAASLVRGTGGA